MMRLAKMALVMAIEVYNPQLNVLMMGSGNENLFAILAEKKPKCEVGEEVYVVAGYRMDDLKTEPDVVFWGIDSLERAKVVYEELVRTF